MTKPDTPKCMKCDGPISDTVREWRDRATGPAEPVERGDEGGA